MLSSKIPPVNNTVLETERILLREMTQRDLPVLKAMLQDKEVMRYYEHIYTDEEVRQWLEKQQKSYLEHGFGLWAVVLRTTGEMIGQCGLTMQQWGEKQVPEIGYLFCKQFWHQGYATEAAMACKKYAFEELGMEEVYSIIRDNNIPSQRVAQRSGMRVQGEFVKHFYGIEMPHLVYSVRCCEEI